MRVPCHVLNVVYVQIEVLGINAVYKVAKSACHPVAAVAYPSACQHLRATRLDDGLLVDGLNLARVKLEGLSGFTAEYQHVRPVKLNTSDRLSANKLHIVDLQLYPLLLGQRSAIIA